jgi:hypothetical protein
MTDNILDEFINEKTTCRFFYVPVILTIIFMALNIGGKIYNTVQLGNPITAFLVLAYLSVLIIPVTGLCLYLFHQKAGWIALASYFIFQLTTSLTGVAIIYFRYRRPDYSPYFFAAFIITWSYLITTIFFLFSKSIRSHFRISVKNQIISLVTGCCSSALFTYYMYHYFLKL